MARTALVDSGFIVALLSRDDDHHQWAIAHATQLVHPWTTCEAVLSESFHLLGKPGRPKLAAMLERGVLMPAFDLVSDLQPVLALMDKYADVPMSLADACLVRMTETLTDPVVVTTDFDFRIYRRHSRQVIPCLMP